jgi:hypothetical protein
MLLAIATLSVLAPQWKLILNRYKAGFAAETGFLQGKKPGFAAETGFFYSYYYSSCSYE